MIDLIVLACFGAVYHEKKSLVVMMARFRKAFTRYKALHTTHVDSARTDSSVSASFKNVSAAESFASSDTLLRASQLCHLQLIATRLVGRVKTNEESSWIDL